MAGEDAPLAVVVAPETAEEASRVAASLRAGGYHPTIDHIPGGDIAGAERLGNFPVLTPLAEVAEAQAFLRGLRVAETAQRNRVVVQPAPSAGPMTAPRRAARALPTVGGALLLLTGLLVVAGGVKVLVAMLQFLNALRDH